MLKRLSSFAALLIIVTVPLAGAQTLLARDPLQLAGTLEKFYPGYHLMVRRGDGRLVDVRGRYSQLERPDGQSVAWFGLRVGDQIDVFGVQRSEKSVDASVIRVTGRSAGSRETTAVRPTARQIEATGQIVSIDSERDSLQLRTADGVRTVELFDETQMRRSTGEPAAVRDLRVGDEVRLLGVERSGRLVAERVTLMPPAAPPVDLPRRAAHQGSEAQVVGTVRTPAYLKQRQVKVLTPQGDVAVDVEEGTPIVKHAERVSVHELERGDKVRIVGTWTGEERLEARRIDVVPPPLSSATLGYRSEPAPMPLMDVIGFVVSYDEDRNRIRLNTREGDRIIVANGTPAFIRGERISRRQIQQGDRLRANGHWNGIEILARKVELAY
jgi:hypothetical protein